MAESDAKEAEVGGGRLRWQAVDEETGDAPKTPRPQLTRTASNASGSSIRSVNRRGSVDPALTLPIHYRSM
jgi:sodium/potassium-transporting ATPase subunit alpha